MGDASRRRDGRGARRHFATRLGMRTRAEGAFRKCTKMTRFVFALALAGVIGGVSARDDAAARSTDRRRRLLADVTGSAFFDVFGFELSASAVFDPVCEFLNPWLHPDYQLRACAGEVAAEDAAGGDQSYVDAKVAPEGSFVNGPTGNVAGGIGGGAIGGVAGGSAGFIGGGVGGGVVGRRRR